MPRRGSRQIRHKLLQHPTVVGPSPHKAGRRVRAGRKRDLLELCFGYGLILAVLWTPAPWQRRFYIFTAVFLVLASFWSGVAWNRLGFGALPPARAWLIPLLAALALALAIPLATRLGTVHTTPSLGSLATRFWGYTVWSFAQQFLLQSFFLVRLRRLLPGPSSRAVLAAALIFAGAHLPNPVLVPFTLLWGLVACRAFLRHRSLYPLGLAHALLGITVAVCIPAHLTHNMRVGLGYLHFHAGRGHGHRRNSDHNVSTRV